MRLVNVPKTAVLVFLMVLCIFSIAGYGSSRRGPDGKSKEDRYGAASPEDVPMRRRIGKQVKLLKGESVEQSVKMLSEVEMFYWPGWSSGAGGIVFPLPEQIGQEDIERIMSNRRFLKVFNELSHLSKERASKLVTKQINNRLPRYKKMFDRTWKRLLDGIKKAPPGMPRSAGPTLQTSNNPDHSPTLAGARLQLLSLVLVAGNLELEGAQPAVLSVLEEALRQRDYLYKSPVLSRLAERLRLPDYLPKSHKGIEADRYLMLTKAGLYNRQILATGIIRTSRKATEPTLPTKERQPDRWESRRLTHYDAAATPYDMWTRGGDPIPVDDSKGSINVRFHKPLDDSEFNSLLGLAGVQSNVSKDSSEGTESQAAWDKKYSDPREFIKLNWISGIPYEKVRRVIKPDSLPLLYDMLKDSQYRSKWYDVAVIICWTGKDADSVAELANYIRRPERFRPDDHARFIGKIHTLTAIGIIGVEQTDELLGKALTEEGALDLARDWIDDPLPGKYNKNRTMVLNLIRGSAAIGSMLSQNRDNMEKAEQLYKQVHAECKRKQIVNELYCHLIDAMVYRDYIAEKGIEAYLNLIGTEAHVHAFGPYFDKYTWH